LPATPSFAARAAADEIADALSNQRDISIAEQSASSNQCVILAHGWRSRFRKPCQRAFEYNLFGRKMVATSIKSIDVLADPASDPPAVRFETVDENAAQQRVDNFLLARLKGVPKSHVYQLLSSGQVRVNKKRVDPSYRLQPEDVVRIPPVRVVAKAPVARTRIRENTLLQPRILYQDDCLIAIDKPAGLAVHGGSGVSLGAIELLRREFPQQRFLELVHRLDRDTSGILLFAKKRAALLGMHEMLRRAAGRDEIEKHYLALVNGIWKNARQHVKARLQKYHTAGGERRVSVDQDGKEAHSVFSLVRAYSTASLLDAQIKTGRTHQIRVHLAHLGFPIVGDDKYGDFALNKQWQSRGLKRMFLHAHQLAFEHPISGERVEIECELSPELKRLLMILEPSHS
jgi:23S rRNA pseudouridine955/2504/2580 synthase